MTSVNRSTNDRNPERHSTNRNGCLAAFHLLPEPVGLYLVYCAFRHSAMRPIAVTLQYHEF
jgi:hypothetical protein